MTQVHEESSHDADNSRSYPWVRLWFFVLLAGGLSFSSVQLHQTQKANPETKAQWKAKVLAKGLALASVKNNKLDAKSAQNWIEAFRPPTNKVSGKKRSPKKEKPKKQKVKQNKDSSIYVVRASIVTEKSAGMFAFLKQKIIVADLDPSRKDKALNKESAADKILFDLSSELSAKSKKNPDILLLRKLKKPTRFLAATAVVLKGKYKATVVVEVDIPKVRKTKDNPYIPFGMSLLIASLAMAFIFLIIRGPWGHMVAFMGIAFVALYPYVRDVESQQRSLQHKWEQQRKVLHKSLENTPELSKKWLKQILPSVPQAKASSGKKATKKSGKGKALPKKSTPKEPSGKDKGKKPKSNPKTSKTTQKPKTKVAPNRIPFILSKDRGGKKWQLSVKRVTDVPVPYASYLMQGILALLLYLLYGFGWMGRGFHALRTHRHAYLYVFPAMLGMLVLVFLPFGFGVGLSAFKYDSGSFSFVGLQNYLKVLWEPDKPLYFYTTLGVTVLWTVTNVFLHVSIGLGLALLLKNPLLRMKAIYRVILILPWAIPNYITALIWKGMFHQQFGVINELLVFFGAERVSWFSSFSTAFCANLVTNTWLGFPFMMVVSLGALQSIPADLYEAAEVDGANKMQKFRFITLPMLKPALFPAIILGSIWTFNMFNVIYLVSGGEPGGSTEILITEAYRLAFEQYRYGYAAAYSTFIFMILLGYSLVTNRVTKATEGI